MQDPLLLDKEKGPTRSNTEATLVFDDDDAHIHDHEGTTNPKLNLKAAALKDSESSSPFVPTPVFPRIDDEGIDDLFSDDDSFGSDFDSAAEEDLINFDSEGDDWGNNSAAKSSESGDPFESPVNIISDPEKLQSERPISKIDLNHHQNQQNQKTSQLTRPGYCLVCKVKPVYSDHSGRIFPTCGLTCKDSLEKAKRHSSNAGFNVAGPSHGGNSQSDPHHWQRRLRGGQMPLSNHSVIKMCEVCQERPRFQKLGKIYPTCGLTCAAKLQDPRSVEMCERPKVVLNGRMYPHCGRTCRDKARQPTSTTANIASCTTCLVCWKSTKKSNTDDFCSVICRSIIDQKAPILIEVPRGHAAFKKVHDYFNGMWKMNEGSRPTIKRIYMVSMKANFSVKYDEYRSTVSSHGLFQKRGNEKKRWLGLTRECGFGNAGNVEPCASTACLLCCLVRGNATRKKFPEGILTANTPNNAVVVSSQVPRTVTNRVVMLADVLLGREAEMGLDELVPPLPPHGHDSVRLVAYNWKGKQELGEIIVFEGAAIKPLYLIVHA